MTIHWVGVALVIGLSSGDAPASPANAESESERVTAAQANDEGNAYPMNGHVETDVSPAVSK